MCCRDAAKLHAQYTDEIQKLRTLLNQKDAEIDVLRDENSRQRNEILRLQHASGEHERQLAKLENEVSAVHMHLDDTVRCAIPCFWAVYIYLQRYVVQVYVLITCQNLSIRYGQHDMP